MDTNTKKALMIAGGAAVAVGVIYYGNKAYQQYQIEKRGPRNLRQMGRRLAARRMALAHQTRGVLTEYGGQPLNTRQLALLRRG